MTNGELVPAQAFAAADPQRPLIGDDLAHDPPTAMDANVDNPLAVIIGTADGEQDALGAIAPDGHVRGHHAPSASSTATVTTLPRSSPKCVSSVTMPWTSFSHVLTRR